MVHTHNDHVLHVALLCLFACATDCTRPKRPFLKCTVLGMRNSSLRATSEHLR